MNDIQVIENFIPKELQDEIENLVNSDIFEWKLYSGTLRKGLYDYENKIGIYDTWQLSHIFFYDGHPVSKYTNIITSMLYHIKNHTGNDYRKRLMKVKTNLLFPTNLNINDNSCHIPHVDVHLDGCETILYYINDSDGDTFLFDEFVDPHFDKKFGGTHYKYENDKAIAPNKMTLNRRITPKKGTAIIFDSNRYHASSSPKNTDRRFVINFVFSEKDLI